MQKTKRRFEIPYNFDKNLIYILKNLDVENNIIIECIYVPAYVLDYVSSVRGIPSYQKILSLSRDEYEEHLNFINQMFPGKIQLLLQGPNKDHILEESILNYYKNTFNITKFCTNNVEQAELIRKLFPESIITASITMCLSLEDIQKLDSDIFNQVVLFFNFNRNFELLKQLPRRFEYAILCNSYCSLLCDGKHHWLASERNCATQKNIYCPKKLSMPWSESINIRAVDLKEFDNYIDIYKLQGREFSTFDLISHLLLFATGDRPWIQNYAGLDTFKEEFYSNVYKDPKEELS